MKNRQLSIYTNEYYLSGTLHLPKIAQGEKVPLIVFLHGFVGSKVGEHRLFVKAARHFTAQGYGVFRFDFSGCGESDGDYGDVTVTKQLSEVQAVLDRVTLLEEVDENYIILIGHSLGGAVASLTAAKDARIHKLILWSPVGQPYEDITNILGESAVAEAKVKGIVDYRGFYVSEPFLTDLKRHQPIEKIRSYEGEALIIHAEDDEAIPKKYAAHYKESLQQRLVHERVNTHYIQAADHTFSSYQFERELFDKSVEWLGTYDVGAKKIV